MDYARRIIKNATYELKGKIEIKSRAAVDSKEALSLAYTPGVAQPCLEIQKDPSKSFDLTRRWNTVAVVTGRNSRAGPWRHRTGGWYAGYGRQMRTVQRVWPMWMPIPLCVRSKDVDRYREDSKSDRGEASAVSTLRISRLRDVLRSRSG